MVNRQAVIRGIVAIQIDEHVNAIVARHIGVARRAAAGRLIRCPGGLPATYADVEEFGVMGQHDCGRPGGIVVQAALQPTGLARCQTASSRRPSNRGLAGAVTQLHVGLGDGPFFSASQISPRAQARHASWAALRLCIE